MIRFCFRLLRRPGNITAAPCLHLCTRPQWPTSISIGLLGRPAPPSLERPRIALTMPFYLRNSFWMTTITMLALLSALIFFLVQWLYQDWTARKDFLEHCQSLQDANKPLTSLCYQALTTPLPPPPFSRTYRVRRYISDSTPLKILLLYVKHSALQQILLIWLCLTALLILYILTIHYIGIKFQWIRLDLYKTSLRRPSLDEEGVLESYEPLQSLRTDNTTTIEALNRSRLRRRGRNAKESQQDTTMLYDKMNRYWLPNIEINKKVITQELQVYLSPDAHVRPYTRDGEDGYLITTPGLCLTDEQIDDICQKSKDLWEKQAAARSKKDAEKAKKDKKLLKRSLHQPIVMSRGSSSRFDNSYREQFYKRQCNRDLRRSNEYTGDRLK